MDRADGHPSRLALITANPVRVGGMQTFTRFLVKTVCDGGWQTTVALSGQDIFQDIAAPSRLNVERVNWVDDSLAGDRRYRWGVIRDRMRWFQRVQPDVALFVQASNTPFRASIVAARLAGVPIVATHRTMPWIRDFVASRRRLFGLVPGLGLHNRRQILKTWITAALAGRIVYNSHHVRRAYEADYHYPRRRGCVIANAATIMDVPTPSKRGSQVVIGYLGRLADEKRVDVLVHAVAAMRQRQSVRLLIFGYGPEQTALVRLANTLGIAKQTSFCDRAGDIASAYAEVDIVAMCSRRESSSNTVLEAMAAGKAVVVSDAGGLPELVDHGRAGICLPVGDTAALAAALDRLVLDEPQRQRLGRQALQLARERHDPRGIGRQWLSLIADVAGRCEQARRRRENEVQTESMALLG